MQDPGYKIQGLGDLESWILDTGCWMLEVRGLPAFGGSDVGCRMAEDRGQRIDVGGRMSEVGWQRTAKT